VEKNLRLAVYPLIDDIVQMMKKESSIIWFEEWLVPVFFNGNRGTR
jgi:hypothetical protein